MLTAWTAHLSIDVPFCYYFFAWGAYETNISKADALTAESLVNCLSQWAKEEGDGALIVAVIGVANNVHLLGFLFHSLF